MNKKFVAFRHTDFFTSIAKVEQYKIYTLTQDEQYYSDESGNGFSIEDVKKYAHNFLLEDDVTKLKEAIAFRVHQSKYGTGHSGDVFCSACGFGYSINPYNEHGLDESHKENIACICGNKFQVVTHVKISFSTHPIK